MNAEKIRLFVKPFCGWCHEAQEWLDERGIKYDLLDVTTDRKARQEMIDLSGQTLAHSPIADESEMKRSWVLKFTTVAAGTNFGTATKDFWTKGQIGEGEHLTHLKVMSEADLVKAGLKLKEGQRPTEIKVFPSPAGVGETPVTSTKWWTIERDRFADVRAALVLELGDLFGPTGA